MEMSKKPELTRRQMLAAMAVSMLGSVAKGSVINQRKTAHHLVDSTKSRQRRKAYRIELYRQTPRFDARGFEREPEQL